MNVDMLCADFLATADLDKLFTGGGWAVSSGQGARGNAAFSCTAVIGTLQRIPAKTPSGSTAIIGFRYKTDGLPASRAMMSVNDTGVEQLTIGLNTDGTITLKTGDFTFGTTLGTTTIALLTNTQYYIELKAVIANSGGSATLYINGVAALTVTGVDTQATANAIWNSYKFLGIGSSATNYVSDIYANDGAGGVNDDVFGDFRVEAHFPDADGANEDWTPSSGADSYAMVDEAAPDGDTTYLETTTAGHRTTCSVEAFKATGGTIKAVAVLLCAEKTDAGAATIAPVIRQGGTNYDGDAKAPSEAVYAYFAQTYDTDPDSAAAWSEAGFNSAEYGVKKEV